MVNLYHSASRSVTVQYDDLELAFDVVAKRRLSDDAEEEEEGASACGSPLASKVPFSCKMVVVSELVRIGGSGFYRWESMSKRESEGEIRSYRATPLRPSVSRSVLGNFDSDGDPLIRGRGRRGR